MSNLYPGNLIVPTPSLRFGTEDCKSSLPFFDGSPSSQQRGLYTGINSIVLRPQGLTSGVLEETLLYCHRACNPPRALTSALSQLAHWSLYLSSTSLPTSQSSTGSAESPFIFRAITLFCHRVLCFRAKCCQTPRRK
jgi:hypothetical protein